MRILIEEYQYNVADIKDILHGIDALENVEGKVSVHYVGYFYNTLLKDCVFILPKVLLKDVEGQELVFGKYKPENIANLDETNPLDTVEKNFLYKFAVWIYRAIVVYKNDKRNDTDIVYHSQLVKNFYIVFEAIIDELIGDNPLPDGMEKKQEDGKIVDHLFTAKSLIENENKRTYYIGDSKYYKMGHELGSESIYKQYTYARNVIQWNLDIFNSGNTTESGIRLRDDVTEGYNIIPNFFVSAKMDEDFSYTNDGIEKTDRKKNRHKQVQFNNRLFDRDTLLLFHYDVNFLFVLSLYARNNAGQKEQWKQKIRERFRSEIQEWLQKDYDFYAMKAHPDVNGEEYIRKHFKELLGKVYTPFAEDNIYSLALDTTNEKNKAENERLLNELKKYFFVADCKLGKQPSEVLQKPISEGYSPIADITKDGVLMVMMENYEGKKQKFLPTGKLAVGIKYTRDGIEIAENLQSIGYVLFHTRKDVGQHLFRVKSVQLIKSVEDLPMGIYKNISTTEIYVVVDIDTSCEMDASEIHSSKKEYTPMTRYDAQYVNINK